MAWKKLGLIFSANSKYDWMHSHCQLPVADYRGENIYRIYFSGRTQQQYAHIGYVDINIYNPKHILEVSSNPVLAPGPLGCFDEYGVFPSSIINVGNQKYLYYIGWIRGFESPMFYASIGLAISNDQGETFLRFSNVPVMDKSKYDPCQVTSPNVFYDKGIFRMTYVSGIKWERNYDNSLKSFYNIKYAQSNDGIHWLREGVTAIDFKDEQESNIARSSVIWEENKYKMWFSYVRPDIYKYRIGYAESDDFIKWKRMDENAGITVSDNGFDSEMICYPNVFIHEGTKYMVYNGNQFGKDGFGLAIWEN